MAIMMLAIPWKTLQTIWRDLGNDPGPDVSSEMREERARQLRGPDLGSERGSRNPLSRPQPIAEGNCSKDSPHSGNRASPSWGK